MTQSKEIRWVRLAEFIIVCDEVNKNNLDFPVMGLNKEKQMMPTVANLEGVNLSKYKLVDNGTFVFSGMQTGRDVCIRIVLATNDNTVLVSPAYTTFRVSGNSHIIPEYLFLWFDRTESDRFGWFISDSSVRSNLDWPRFLDIKIPVPYKDGEPDVVRQKEVVDIWQGLRKLKEENEAIAQPLLDLCQAKMDELKHSAPMVQLGEYIHRIDDRNRGNLIRAVKGISVSKEYREPTSKVNKNGDLSSYKIVRYNQFGYIQTTNNEKRLVVSLSKFKNPIVISSVNEVFELNDDIDFIPDFLQLWFLRPEVDRYGRYNSWGSARETFPWSEMCRMKVPKPSIEVQRAIVDIYRCAREAKNIAEEATKQLKTICPALMQHIIHS